jgi:hypothetical protein|tara:strand:- start:771 stop:1490 length:720 start_codon:yes stop_codon:yes gene_type:complete
MAISIDTVYQRVLAIANKEQRGYITPQEFNLLANQAQMEVFEEYFYDINKFDRINNNDTEYSNMISLLEEKISPFEKYRVSMSAVSGNQLTLPTDVYRLGLVFYGAAGYDVEVEQINKKELLYVERSPLAAPTSTHPVYVRKTDTTIKVFPSSPTTAYSVSNITCNYVARPTDIIWGYTDVSGTALYNSGTSTNPQLHESEETTLVIKILALAGIILQDPSMYQIATGEDNKKTQQEKQ